MRLEPQRAGRDDWIDTGLDPPCGFIAATMNLAVVAPAQRHGELIAHFSPERAMLREPQMMGIRGSAATNDPYLERFDTAKTLNDRLPRDPVQRSLVLSVSVILIISSLSP